LGNLVTTNGHFVALERVMPTSNKFGIFPVFRGLDGKLTVQKEVPFSSEEEARRAGRIFAEVLGGAVAFRRMNDPDAGVVGQGVIIAKYGVMAEERSEPPVPTNPDKVTKLIDHRGRSRQFG
jgi:hypothetical protein